MGTVKKHRTGAARVKKLPREILSDLRARSGLTGTEIARLCGFASTSGYKNYEYVTQRDKPIPGHVIMKLIPVLTGRGTPPITREELLAISDIPNLLPSSDTTLSAPSNVTPLRKAATLLPIKYRVERGVYADVETIASRTYGTAPFGPTVDLDDSSQFAAIVVDGDRREVLHCAVPDQLSAEARVGKRCVCLVPRKGAADLVEVAIGRVLPTGDADRGRMVAVVIGSYLRE